MAKENHTRIKNENTRLSIQQRFIKSLKHINMEISKLKLQGVRKYYNKYDAQAIWEKQEGYCYYCGYPLVLGGKGFGTPNLEFANRVPIKLGGPITRENLIALCTRCKRNKSKTRIPSNLRLIGYNAFSDLIVQLVQAVHIKDEERIRYFKQAVDFTLKDIIDSAYYQFEGKKHSNTLPENSVSDIIKKISEELSKEISIAIETRSYNASRQEYIL